MKICAEPEQVVPDGQSLGVSTWHSLKQVREPLFPRHVSPEAQWVSSHESPASAFPTATQLVVPSSFTTAQVSFVGQAPKSKQWLMGTHTGTSNFPETTGCTSQNEGVYVPSHAELPLQQ